MFIGDREPPHDLNPRAVRIYTSAVDRLSRADWPGACSLFREITADSPDCADAWEGLAEASWWLLDESGIFDARERAHQLYRTRGDDRSAARMATWLAMDYVELRGEHAISNGWLQKAYRLLERQHSTEEFGWLLLFHSRIQLITGGDGIQARSLASRAAGTARRLGLTDLAALALSVEGLLHLATADVDRAVACLDESAAGVMAGEVKNLTAEALTLCQLMSACERTKDFDRARQWCERARRVSEERTFPALLALCRPHYASVLMWHGEWKEAERHLEAADRELMEFMPPYLVEASARLATLRLRQGRWEEAARMFAEMDHPAARLGMAELAAGQGQLETAVDLLERYIRQVPEADGLERAAALELLGRCHAELGRFSEAEQAIGLLREIAGKVATLPLRASCSYAAGHLALQRGDLEEAQRFLEDAVDEFRASGAPFESARARIALAEALARRNRRDAAAREGEAARETMREMGAVKELERAERVLTSIRELPGGAGSGEGLGLTSRELDVLRLLSSGRSNQEIAADLVLSVRTVERHISNIYQKLGLHGAAARTTAAARARRSGLAD